MIAIGIIFLILYFIMMTVTFSCLTDIREAFDEIVKLLKKKK